jgi:ribonuclease III
MEDGTKRASDPLSLFNDALSSPISDPGLLKKVFTHRSYLNEADTPGLESNERLEFLGDAVLSTVISEMLYGRFPGVDEGGLTRLRARLVNRRTLAGLAKDMGLDKLLLLGKGEAASGGHENPSILAGTFEALIAAIYIDSGFAPASSFIERLFTGLVDESLTEPVHFDYKPRLQELSQSIFKEAPEYRLKVESGPPHEKVFEIEAIVGGEILGTGVAGKKKDAEQAAAKEALEKLKERFPDKGAKGAEGI